MEIIKTILLLILTLPIMAQCKSTTEKNNTNMNTTTTHTSSKEIIVDVRTPEEWKFDGHADCSVNYPLASFATKIDELKKYEKVTLVCRSGGRASVAAQMLTSAGYKNKITNLGAWQNVTCSR